MKKYFLICIFLFSFVLLGCTQQNSNILDIDTISDLGTLETKISQISESLKEGTIDPEFAQKTIEKLQQKYLDLKNTTSTTIEDKFASIQKMFVGKKVDSYTLPLWAKKMGMSLPKGMSLDTKNSRQTYLNTEGHDYTMLVYTGAYTLAMNEAQYIADKADLFVSKDFIKGQKLAQNTNTNYISGLDMGNLAAGIVYVNHELLDTSIEYSLSVSVDQHGTLTIETIQYK